MSAIKDENFYYELAFFLSSSISENEKEEKLNNILKLIEELKGTILETVPLELKALAYPIKKETSGYFGVVKFKLDGSLMEELNKQLKLLPEMLRFLIVKKEEIKKPVPLKKMEKEKTKVETKKEEEKEVSLEELEKKLEEILKE